MKRALLIFVKNAVKGNVKTRLAATLGDETALAIYQDLLQHTANSTQLLLIRKIVCYTDYVENEDVFSNEKYEKQIQTGDDLGERMQNAFEDAFANDNDQVAIIGSDCFEITTIIIANAFKQLDDCDVVVGPALDGGYYLLALKSDQKALFQNIQWSMNKVLNQTLAICQEKGLKVVQLQALSDIDNENDLKRIGYNYSIHKT